MEEEEIVRWMLSACNPRLTSGLRGIVSLVEQVVKVGSLIARVGVTPKTIGAVSSSLTRQKGRGGRWSRGQVEAPGWTSPLPWGSRPSRLCLQICEAQMEMRSLTLGVLIADETFLIRKQGEVLEPSGIPKFVMANTQENRTIGKATLLLSLQDCHGTRGVHGMPDDHLCMLLLLGLHFVTMAHIILKPHLRKCVMPGGKEFKFLHKTRDKLLASQFIFTWL
ncbi:uncharacterized protein LOC129169766 [Dunckerocampus dactyliophorus]|uniref:uncharacterized protein LOC129169766 n=1 Tax=Dunckerocampus dactyliophorus TaxID=161453 RepID=UPI00240709F8|nr:uncharacterized protein LOC129169766 [Dunckerocampus dactyliophorus]